jgi:membrane protease YdiL (CAAX protease family)
MTAVGRELSESPFIANLAPREHSVARLAFAIVAVLVTFIVVQAIVTLAVLLAFVPLAGWPAPTSLEGARGLAQRLVDLTRSDGRRFSDVLEILALAIPSNVASMFASIGVAALIHGRPLRTYMTAAPHFRWRTLAVGFGLSLLIVGPFLGVAQMLDPKAPPPPLLTVGTSVAERGLYAVICFIGFFPAALGEEILFRGWLLRETSALTRNALALMLVNGAVFAAFHLQFAPDVFLTRWIMGAGFVYMTLRLGGVELSSGAHFANNILVVLFLQPLSLKPPPSSFSADSLLQDAFLFAAYVAIAEITARWAPLRRWSGADLAPPPAIAEAEHFA